MSGSGQLAVLREQLSPTKSQLGSLAAKQASKQPHSNGSTDKQQTQTKEVDLCQRKASASWHKDTSWVCNACTLNNPSRVSSCNACGEPCQHMPVVDGEDFDSSTTLSTLESIQDSLECLQINGDLRLDNPNQIGTASQALDSIISLALNQRYFLNVQTEFEEWLSTWHDKLPLSAHQTLQHLMASMQVETHECEYMQGNDCFPHNTIQVSTTALLLQAYDTLLPSDLSRRGCISSEMRCEFHCHYSESVAGEVCMNVAVGLEVQWQWSDGYQAPRTGVALLPNFIHLSLKHGVRGSTTNGSSKKGKQVDDEQESSHGFQNIKVAEKEAVSKVQDLLKLHNLPTTAFLQFLMIVGLAAPRGPGGTSPATQPGAMQHAAMKKIIQLLSTAPDDRVPMQE